MAYKVKATRRGFYGGRIREPGDPFTISKKDHFSTIWMRDPNTPEEPDEVDDEVDEDEDAFNKAEDLPVEEPEEKDDEEVSRVYTRKHRGNGKYDVYDPDGNVILDNATKKKSAAKVKEMNEG